MSKVIKWKYADFLKSHINKSKILNEQQYLKKALNKLEYTLSLLKNFEKDLSDEEFDKFIKIIYEIIKEIVVNIE